MDFETVFCLVIAIIYLLLGLPLLLINLLFIVGHILEEYDEE